MTRCERTLGQTARDHVRQYRSIKVMADQWRDTITRLVGRTAAADAVLATNRRVTTLV
jgi:hypothetical protein